MTDKFEWRLNDVLWQVDRDVVAGWLWHDPGPPVTWIARTAGSVANPTVRAEFDNKESAKDFLMFLANLETP